MDPEHGQWEMFKTNGRHRANDGKASVGMWGNPDAVRGSDGAFRRRCFSGK